MEFGVAPGRALIKNFVCEVNRLAVAASGTFADGTDGRPDDDDDHEVLGNYLVSPMLL